MRLVPTGTKVSCVVYVVAYKVTYTANHQKLEHVKFNGQAQGDLVTGEGYHRLLF
jgi:hypothetical protein